MAGNNRKADAKRPRRRGGNRARIWQPADRANRHVEAPHVKGALHYTACGLPNVWLQNGFKRHRTAYGSGTSIEDIDGLHRLIARTVVGEKQPLGGPEIRFLRKEMDMSQASLARLVGISDQTVARWEKGETAVDPSADRLIRLIWRDYAKADPHVLEALQELAELDEHLHGRRVLERERSTWKLAA